MLVKGEAMQNRIIKGSNTLIRATQAVWHLENYKAEDQA
jgi:hypothetical protein